MIKNKKLLSVLSTVLMLGVIITGCGGGGEDKGSGSTKDTLIVAQGADAKSLDPHASNDSPSSRVLKQINETLVYQDEKMELKPGLAESWEQLDDITYEFKLKKGVKFHNGEELKASDVKFTILRALESPSVSHIVGSIDPAKLEIVDDYTIKISTKEPFASLLAHLAHPSSSILSEKAVTESGENYGQNPVGTGAFKFVKWNTGDSIELTVFEDFHGEAPKYKNLTFRAIAEATNRTIELEAGTVDISYDILPSDMNRIEESEELELYKAVNLSTNYIGFNMNKEPFNNLKVRQAINHALDKESIIEAVLQGSGSVAKGPIGPNVFGVNQDLDSYKYDVDKAKALLAEAGYPNGFKTTIWTNDSAVRMDICTILQNQLKQIGIEVEVKVVEWGAYLAGTAKGEHDMFILGWTTVTGDADYGLYSLFHSSQFGDAGNRTFYSNDKIDELLDLGRKSVNPEERVKAYKEVQEIVNDEAPWVFLYNAEYLDGARSNVKGFIQHPAGHHLLRTVYFE
ncbi:MAG: glutathione ABC transporter substrate-binding protein [Clostridiaceae bacterium]